MFQRVVNQFVEFLWRQELVQDHALRPHNRRRVQNADAAARVRRGLDARLAAQVRSVAEASRTPAAAARPEAAVPRTLHRRLMYPWRLRRPAEAVARPDPSSVAARPLAAEARPGAAVRPGPATTGIGLFRPGGHSRASQDLLHNAAT